MYDGINRLTEIRDFNREIIQQILYNNANAQTDGRGNKTHYTYDGADRLLSVTDALGNETVYTYDGARNLLSQTDGNGNRTTYRYNVRNLVSAKTDPSGKADSEERYTYDSVGRLTSKTDRNQVVTVYAYDFLGRVILENAGGEVIRSIHDANGNLLTMEDASGITVRTYDALNRTISKNVPNMGKSTYAYDLAGSEAGTYGERTTDPKGNVTERIYDKAGRLWKVKTGGETTVYAYYPNGTKKSITYPDGTTQAVPAVIDILDQPGLVSLLLLFRDPVSGSVIGIGGLHPIRFLHLAQAVQGIIGIFCLSLCLCLR